MRAYLPAVVCALGAPLLLGFVPPGPGGPPADARADVPPEAADEPVVPSIPLPVLEARPRWSAGLEGYAGIAAQWTSGEDRAHGLVGGLARVRFSFVQVGGTFETTDSGEATGLNEPIQEHWRAVGGFAGVWLPYRHWVDVDASLGLSSRSYINPSQIYGPGGFDRSGTLLTFRLGVSDRATERLFGVRVGAALVGGIDLQRHSPAWHRQFLLPGGGVGDTTGTTEIGGVSIALVVGAGFELGGGAISAL
jgi:hypothetical protein